jgi:ipoprotein LpqH
MLGSVAIGAVCTCCTTTPSGRRANEGKDRMKRVLAAVIGLMASATLLMACSGNKSAPATSVAGGGAQVTTGGGAQVKIDGGDLAGLDPKSVTCVKQGGKINVGSGSVGGQQAVAVVMTDAAPPTVESLGLVVDGNALAVTNNMGAKVGSADVKVDGNTYTITGEAQGADIKNPMAGMITKKFSIKVTCG